MRAIAELGAIGRNLSQLARVAIQTGRVIGVGLRQIAWCAQSMTPRWVECHARECEFRRPRRCE
jgi:hypothetical protein